MWTPEQLIEAEDALMFIKKALRDSRTLNNSMLNVRIPRALTERGKALTEDLEQFADGAKDRLDFMKGTAACTCPRPQTHWTLAQMSKQTKIDPTKCVKPEGA